MLRSKSNIIRGKEELLDKHDRRRPLLGRGEQCLQTLSRRQVSLWGTDIHKHAQEQVQNYQWKGGIARQA